MPLDYGPDSKLYDGHGHEYAMQEGEIGVEPEASNIQQAVFALMRERTMLNHQGLKALANLLMKMNDVLNAIEVLIREAEEKE